jgi:hypothetical protein
MFYGSLEVLWEALEAGHHGLDREFSQGAKAFVLNQAGNAL